jgi:hypothetical protein
MRGDLTPALALWVFGSPGGLQLPTFGSVGITLTLSPKWGYDRTWESAGTPETSEFDCKGQNTSPWAVLYIIEKLSKLRCRKWARMSHLDVYSTSYGKKKGRESNWQFDSRPLKVGNRPDPGACKWSAIHRWKALDESYKFASDLIPIGGLSKKLWLRKVARVQTGIISKLLLGSPGIKKTIWMQVPWRGAENTIWRKVVGSPESGPWWVLWVQGRPWLVLAPRCSRMWTNQLVVGLMQIWKRVTKSLSLFPVLSQSSNTPPLPPSSVAS